MTKEILLNKINNNDATIGVIGVGYVGLPLAVEFAEAGYCVTGFDVNEEKAALLNKGESYILDIPSDRLEKAVKLGCFEATTEFPRIAEMDVVIICVPTPLRKTRDPDMSFVIAATEEVAKYATSGTLIVLESTTYPGTTDELIVPRLAGNGFTVGEDVFICFSPERVDPGNPVYGIRNTPKVIGGVTPSCLEIGLAIYGKAIDTLVPVESTRAAEMVKLLENTFRAVNIGLVNEMAIMCDKLDVNVWEVIDAAASKPFGFMTFYPGPGLGGHCIPIDPLYLSWKLKTLNYNARFIDLASEINSDMPNYVIEKVVNGLNDDEKSVRGSKVLVLGVAYKPDIDDLRESPALDVIRLLEERGAVVSYHDPHVPDLSHESIPLQSLDLSDDLLAGADCVVIVTNHKATNWQQIADHAKLVIDCRNALREIENPSSRVILL